MFFPVIEAKGTPYEIGFIHGSKAKSYIDNSIKVYTEAFRDYANMSWQEAKELSKSFIPFIEEYDSDLMEEIKGVAHGAKLDLEDILALNARSEIWFNGKNMNKPMDGCTSFAATPDITKNGEVLIGQTWDWKPTIKSSLIALKIEQKNKPDISMITEAGIIGKIGFNSYGLGVCLNALVSESKPIGVPLHIVLRGILNSETINDALLSIGKAKIACAANFLIAHKEGEALDVEAWPGDFDVLYPEDGYVVHTNHFTSPRSIMVKDTGKLLFPDSFIRYGKINSFIKSNKGQIDINLMKKIYTNHAGYPDSICRHGDLRDEPGMRTETLFCIFMDLLRREMYVAPGTPCNSQFELYRF